MKRSTFQPGKRGIQINSPALRETPSILRETTRIFYRKDGTRVLILQLEEEWNQLTGVPRKRNLGKDWSEQSRRRWLQEAKSDESIRASLAPKIKRGVWWRPIERRGRKRRKSTRGVCEAGWRRWWRRRRWFVQRYAETGGKWWDVKGREMLNSAHDHLRFADRSSTLKGKPVVASHPAGIPLKQLWPFGYQGFVWLYFELVVSLLIIIYIYFLNKLLFRLS